MTYILGVLLSLYADKKIYALYSSLFSVLTFNFFFTDPYLSLRRMIKGIRLVCYAVCSRIFHSEFDQKIEAAESGKREKAVSN